MIFLYYKCEGALDLREYMCEILKMREIVALDYDQDFQSVFKKSLVKLLNSAVRISVHSVLFLLAICIFMIYYYDAIYP